MMIEILQIRDCCKCFTLVSLFIDRLCFAAKLCIYYRERYDSGTGLFYFQIGRFAERRSQFGIKIQVLRYEWAWYKKKPKTELGA